MIVSTPTVAPENPSGAAPAAEPTHRRVRWAPIVCVDEQIEARVNSLGFVDWLRHIKPAAGCVRPIRLSGDMYTVAVNQNSGAWRVVSSTSTQDMPDGVIYKPCGNRRAAVCPACSRTYQRDAYQIVRTLLVGGKGVPETVASHPAVFVTLTAPSFGQVHTRIVRRHTCRDRRQCDCRPEPCHARRDNPRCPHGRPAVCFARHDDTDRRLGTPLCLDCYDHAAQVVWNNRNGELWRRTRIAIERNLKRCARQRGIDPATVKLAYGRAAEFQRRGVVHLHIIIRLDGYDPDRPDAILPPPAGLDAVDLVDAVEQSAKVTRFWTDPHPDHEDGWRIGWGEQTDARLITVAANGDVTDAMVAAYLAKYATKSTEVTGHASGRLSSATVDLYADADGTHNERLLDACWRLGRPVAWRGLRRWAHMLAFGGHFLTKSHRHRVTFRLLKGARTVWRRTVTSGPDSGPATPQRETVLVTKFLQFVGAGWHTAGDAVLAVASADMARSHDLSDIRAFVATVA